jgi:hypothetical protein
MDFEIEKLFESGFGDPEALQKAMDDAIFRMQMTDFYYRPCIATPPRNSTSPKPEVSEWKPLEIRNSRDAF